MGYPFAKKGYKLYSLTSRTCFISRDVISLEHIFPFFKTFNQSSHILLSPLSSYFDTNHFVSIYPPSPSSPVFSLAADPPSPGLHPSPTSSLTPASPPVSSSPLSILRRSSGPHNPPSYLNS